MPIEYTQTKNSLRVGCHNIVAYCNKTHKSRLVQRRWYRLVDYITGNGYKQQSQHIKGKDNKIADYLCRELIKPMRNNIILEVIQQFIMKNFGYNIFTFKATEPNKINYLHFQTKTNKYQLKEKVSLVRHGSLDYEKSIEFGIHFERGNAIKFFCFRLDMKKKLYFMIQMKICSPTSSCIEIQRYER